MKKIISLIILASSTLIILISFVFLSSNDGKLHIVVCDVGQGDAIYIRTPQKTDILIDGGPDKSVLNCLSKNMPFWDREINAVILTHPHADHMTGLIDVIDRYKLNAFYRSNEPGTSQIYELLEAKLADKKLSAKVLHKGDRLSDKSGFSLEVLWPASSSNNEIGQNKSNIDLNNVSIITLLKYKEFKVLLTGDAGVKIEDIIAGEAGDIDLLKVPHHGSKTGMSDTFLNVVKPEIAVISNGKDNKYGHPAPFILSLLKNHGVKTLRTDLDGEVDILSDGLNWSVKTKN